MEEEEEFLAKQNELDARKDELKRKIGILENAFNTNLFKHCIKRSDQSEYDYDYNGTICMYTNRFNNLYNEDEGRILFSSKEFEVELVDDRYYVIRKIY